MDGQKHHEAHANEEHVLCRWLSQLLPIYQMLDSDADVEGDEEDGPDEGVDGLADRRCPPQPRTRAPLVVPQCHHGEHFAGHQEEGVQDDVEGVVEVNLLTVPDDAYEPTDEAHEDDHDDHDAVDIE